LYDKENSMGVKLRVIAGNPSVVRGPHLNGRELHWLADSLTTQVQAGNTFLAHLIASRANLNPLNISVLATWMSRSGLSEHQILEVVA
jgi:hypothetical protein